MDLTDRFLHWSMRQVTPGWLTWLLGVAALFILAWSIQDAAWVPDSSPISFNLFAGAFFGLCLAVTRWGGGWAALYTTLLGVVITLQDLGRIVPPLGVIFATPPLALVELMNVRLFAMLQRMGGWLSLYQSGETIHDTGLFLLLFALLGWLTGAWLSWCLRRTRRTLAGVFPAGLLLGANVNFSAQDPWMLTFFLLVVAALAARTALAGAYAGWERRKVDYPEGLGMGWAGWAATLGVIVCLVARSAALLGTPEGWKLIGDWLRPAQQQVEDTAVRIFGDVRPPKVTSAPPLPRADTPQLSAIGAAPSQGSEVIFSVSTSDPPPPPQDAGIPEQVRLLGPRHYWRSQVFATYTGQGWDPAPLEADPIPPPSPTLNAPPGRYALEQQFELTSTHGSELFAANQPVSIQPGLTELLQASGDVQSTLLSAARRIPVDSYTVTSWANRLTQPELEAAPRQYPQEISELYLQLPSSLPQRVRDLAGRIVSGATTPFGMAMRIQTYLRITYAYSVTVPPPPPGRDVVDYFLFETQTGFCSYYASAMAVMLRSQGVPARVASGFAMGTYNADIKAYQVETGDAHAWVEVFFPGLGWVEFEPTVSQETFDYPAALVAGPAATPVPPSAALPPSLAAALLIFILLLGAGLLFLLFRFTGRSSPAGRLADPAAQARQLYRRVRFGLAQAGLSARPSLTPAEYLALSRPALARRPTLARLLEQATALYEQAVYSSHPPALQAVESARRAWGASFWEWVRLWLGKRRGPNSDETSRD